jgi:K+-transporting ATPase ATPase A chain
LIPAVISEMNGNPAISHIELLKIWGSGRKEVRLCCCSANWATYTTVTSNGSVNAMHDSMTPIAGMTTLFGMMINCFLWWLGGF